MKRAVWTAHDDGTRTATIRRRLVTIYPPRPWSFWRGEDRSKPCHTGPGESFTVGFKGSHSGGAHTLAGAEALAEWSVGDHGKTHGHPMPDNLQPAEELAARALFEETVAMVNRTYGET